MADLRTLSSQFDRLDITADNMSVYVSLLTLPFDLFRPIIDMLLDESITIEDLTTPGNLPPGTADALVASSSAGLPIDEATLRQNVLGLLQSGRAVAAMVPRDVTLVHTDRGGHPSGLYAAGGATSVSPDTTANTPSPLEVIIAARTGADPRTIAQAALAAATQPSLTGGAS